MLRFNSRFAAGIRPANGSDAGGRTAAVLYTMTQSCKRHGVDPFAYLSDVLARLPNTPADHLDQLLPDRWAAARPAATQ